MKSILNTILSICIALGSAAQTGSYRQDLETLKASLEKTFSYRAQIRGDKADAYKSLYARLLADSLHPVNSLPYFHNLCQLIFPLKDNHLALYQLPDNRRFASKTATDSFIASPAFHEHPKISLNIDSLREALKNKPADSIEGIYHYGIYYSVGLYREGNGELTGVILDTETPTWAIGQVAIKLYPYAPGMYKGIYAHPVSKHFMIETNEKFRDGALINSKFYASYTETIYAKSLQQQDHVNLPSDGPRYYFEKLNPSTDYLLIRSFQNNTNARREVEALYARIKDSLTAPNLVLDLRNNEGGSEGMGEPLYKLMSKYSRKGKLWILINNGTLSQAEIQLMRLIKLPNVTTVGQPTKGMLTYGSNYGKRIRLPSGRIEFYPTDMRGSEVQLRYEDIGIQPDIMLNNQRSWLEQIVEIIN